MPDANNDNANFWIKLSVYVLGTALGVGAKLADMRRHRKITMTDAVIETLIAGAASYFVWCFCHYKLKEDDLAIMASVIVGRFGDHILYSALEKIENIIKKISEK